MAHTPTQNRISSIDIMRGIVMLLMVIDHVRGAFTEVSLWLFGNASQLLSNVARLDLFSMRWITHICAPSFVFLAGVSIYFWLNKYGKDKSLIQHFVLRGLLLIFVDLCINGRELISQSGFVYMGVLWAIGASMILFPFVAQLPKKGILLLAIGITVISNTPDIFSALSTNDIWKAFIIKGNLEVFSTQNLTFHIGYPVLPWFAVMLFGFYFAPVFALKSSPQRLKILVITGISFLFAFILLRATGIFGDSLTFSHYDTAWQTVASFINITKYPPSLQYLLLTLGIMFLMLYLIEVFNIKTKFLLVFGTTPLFFYCLHLFYIKVTAVILKKISPLVPIIGDLSFSATGVVIYSILISIVLYPSCLAFKHVIKKKK